MPLILEREFKVKIICITFSLVSKCFHGSFTVINWINESLQRFDGYFAR